MEWMMSSAYSALPSAAQRNIREGAGARAVHAGSEWKPAGSQVGAARRVLAGTRAPE